MIFGVRHEAGLLYHAEWQELEKERANFAYRPTLTRPPEHWSGLTGRVQPHVLEALGDRRDVDIYVCGLREMVDEMRAQLKAIGLDRKAHHLREIRLNHSQWIRSKSARNWRPRPD